MTCDWLRSSIWAMENCHWFDEHNGCTLNNGRELKVLVPFHRLLQLFAKNIVNIGETWNKIVFKKPSIWTRFRRSLSCMTFHKIVSPRIWVWKHCQIISSPSTKLFHWLEIQRKQTPSWLLLLIHLQSQSVSINTAATFSMLVKEVKCETNIT